MGGTQRQQKSTTIVVHVQPRAKRTEITGWYGDAIKIRISAPPVEGAANEELIRFVAERVGVPKRDVRILSGSTTRRKRIAVAGLTPARLLAALDVAVE